MIHAWVYAIRPRTLAVGFIPVLMGSIFALKQGHFHFLGGISALISTTFIQIGTNLANDYFDFVNGADTQNRLGPKRLTASGEIRPETMRFGMQLAFLLAVVFAGYILVRGGWPILIIGLVGIAMGILYTGGPFPLGYHGFGDVVSFIFFGPVALAGTYYVHALHWSVDSVLLGISPGLFSVAILAVNNARDVIEDSQTGKRTLAVKWGISFVRVEFLLSIIIASSFPFLLTLIYTPGDINRWVLVSIIPAIKLIDSFIRSEGSGYNETLSLTVKCYCFFLMVWALGEVL